MTNEIWGAAQFKVEWKDDNYNYKLFDVPRSAIDENSKEPDAHLLIGLDSGNVRRVDLLLDAAYSRTIRDENGDLATALVSAPVGIEEILSQYIDSMPGRSIEPESLPTDAPPAAGIVATISGEPSRLILDRIYAQGQTRKIVVDGHDGTIEAGPGGWGNPAIIIAMADGTRLVARECESEDYANVKRDPDGCFEPDALEVYNWQRDGEDGYYSTISNALARRNVLDRAL